MNQKQVFPYIFQYLHELINGYVALPDLTTYIVSPGLGNQAGIIGSLFLAKQAIQEENKI